MIQQIGYVMSPYWKLKIHTEMRNNTAKKITLLKKPERSYKRTFLNERMNENYIFPEKQNFNKYTYN